MSSWQQQQQQPGQQEQQQQQEPRVGAITGGADVCVWDAFGAFWCERKPSAAQPPLGGGYVQRTTQQGSRPIVYEGFCGCGADSAAAP